MNDQPPDAADSGQFDCWCKESTELDTRQLEPVNVVGYDPLLALDICDALVVAATLRCTVSVSMEVAAAGCSILLAGGERGDREFWVPRQAGEVACVRLMLLAGLDSGLSAEQIARLCVRVGSGSAELILIANRGRSWRNVIIRRLVTLGEPDNPRRSLGPECSCGETLGNYVIERELGRGGMGVVFKARHKRLQRLVAIKLIYAAFSQRADLADRFLREARAACRIKHPGVVQVIDFGVLTNGRPYLVMELVEEPTLRTLLNTALLPVDRALRLCMQVADALDAAHRDGVIHRDLKPENIFVLDGDRIKLADFGAAKLIDDQAPSDTLDGVVLGTPLYMAPEHARGRGTDARTDVYSLGCILFEMLTGAVPYPGGNSVEVINHHLNAPVPPMKRHDQKVPSGLEVIVARAMAKEPADRYQTAGEFAHDLHTAANRAAKWRRIPFIKSVQITLSPEVTPVNKEPDSHGVYAGPTRENSLRIEVEARGMTVLVVDDEPTLLALIGRCLEAAGFIAITAGSGEDAVRVLNSRRVDVLVSDLVMPGMGGGELLVYARKHYHRIPRIAMTGRGTLDAVARTVNEAEIFRLIAKPCGPGPIIGAVLDALRPSLPSGAAGSPSRARSGPIEPSDPVAAQEANRLCASPSEYGLDPKRVAALIAKLRSCGLAGLAEVLRTDVLSAPGETQDAKTE